MYEYSNNEIKIGWDKKKCIHSAVCINTLPEVFNLENRQWVNVNGSGTDAIINAINKCPSGALTFELENNKIVKEDSSETEVKFIKNGPILLKGKFKLIDSDGKEKIKSESFALCRCGSSLNKPYCDGSHKKINFIE